MKKINNLLKLVVIVGVLFVSSCETTEIDKTQNPNALSPEQANPDFFLNSIQEDYARFVENYGLTGAQLTRISYMSGRDYSNAYSPSFSNGRWTSAYQGMLKDIQVMNTLAEEADLKHHIGMGQLMQAHIMMTLVDFYGPVPYSQALMDIEELNPAHDDGASIYSAAIDLLNKAITNFGSAASGEPEYDFFYDGDWDKWIKAANSLKMKAYITTRLVDPGAEAAFNAIVSSGNYIMDTSDDFQFRWGTNEIDPDTRHPAYSASYTTTGGGRYQSNSLMDYMKGKNEEGYSNPLNFDPRTMFYFYRQVWETPGIDGDADEETLECGLQVAPLHYDGYVFCGVTKGWWGRDHGNDNGIPPDGFLRTLAGVYPAGGALDDLSYDPKVNGDGNGGAGVTPIILANWSKFMIAEFQMLNSDEDGARTSMLDGINQSIDKVVNFMPTTERFEDKFGDGDGDPDIYHLDDLINWFNIDIEADWDAADTEGRWDILAQQYFVAMFGNGADAYNFYRRTGYPRTLQPNIEPSPGSFIRSFYYPDNHANTNSNVTQKSDVTDQVFWDTNPGSPSFPIAN